MDSESGSDANEGQKDEADIVELCKAREEKVKALSRALQGRDEQLARVQQASEEALEAYDELQSRCQASDRIVDVAVLQASQLYHENQKLKRQSAKLMMKFQEFRADDVVLQLDDLSCDSPGAEAEDAHGYVTDLKGRLTEERHLKAQLGALQAQLDEERLRCSEAKERLARQTELLERLQNVSEMAVEDYDRMRRELVEKRDVAEKAVDEVREVRKERNALVRTSAILMGNVPPDHKLHEALTEVERLTLALETAEIERENAVESEKEFRQTAEELQARLDRLVAECGKLEEKEKRKSDRITLLETQVADLQKRIKTKSAPPPPPPPPPQPTNWNPFGALMSAIGLSRKTAKPITAVPNEDKAKKAMDEIIEKIEKGTFRLKPTAAGFAASDALDGTTGDHRGIQEMRSVLSTLRKGSSVRTPRRVAEEPRRDFGYSLRLKPGPFAAWTMPERESPPELENVLLRRRLAVDAADGTEPKDAGLRQ